MGSFFTKAKRQRIEESLKTELKKHEPRYFSEVGKDERMIELELERVKYGNAPKINEAEDLKRKKFEAKLRESLNVNEQQPLRVLSLREIMDLKRNSPSIDLSPKNIQITKQLTTSKSKKQVNFSLGKNHKTVIDIS